MSSLSGRLCSLLSVIYGCGLAASIACSGPADAQSKHGDLSEKAFDGVYTVDIETSVGDCEKSRQVMMAISNGRVAAIQDPSIQTTGLIDPHGSVSLALRKDNDITHIGGKMKGKTGVGTWSSPTRQCGGSWRAARQD